MTTASAPASPAVASQKAMLWIVFAGFFMQTLDTTIVNTALPSMAHSLGEKPLDLKPVVVASALDHGDADPRLGWLADEVRHQACVLLRHPDLRARFHLPRHGPYAHATGDRAGVAGARVDAAADRPAVALRTSRRAVHRGAGVVSIAGRWPTSAGAGGWLVQSASCTAGILFEWGMPVGLVGLLAQCAAIKPAGRRRGAAVRLGGLWPLSLCAWRRSRWR